MPKHLYEGVDVADAARTGTADRHRARSCSKEWVRGSHARAGDATRTTGTSRSPISTAWSSASCPTRPRAPPPSRPATSTSAASRPCRSPTCRASRRIRASPSTRADFAYTGAQNQIFFNLDSEPMKNSKLREAIAHALDLDSHRRDGVLRLLPRSRLRRSASALEAVLRPDGEGARRSISHSRTSCSTRPACRAARRHADAAAPAPTIPSSTRASPISSGSRCGASASTPWSQQLRVRAPTSRRSTPTAPST